jgi:hypothetical protein
LLDRLRPQLGGPVSLRCLGSLSVGGVLTQLGSEWLLLDEGAGREAFVVVSRLLWVAGLGPRATVLAGSSGLTSRLGLRHALRGIARDRSSVRLHLIDGSVLHGTLDRVGADFVELAVHAPGEPRRRSEVRDVVVVATTAVVALKRDGA